MILSRVHPAPAESIDLDDADARERLADLYRPPRPEWVRLNLVASVSGNATGSDGTSETLTNAADRLLLGVIRSLADVVVVGAASVRAEGYFVPRRAALAVVTSSGDLSSHRITTTGTRGPLIILCPESAKERAESTVGDAARVIALPSVNGVLEARAIVGALRAEGLGSIVCEGGPALASHLVRGGMVDEACITTSPLLNGAPLPVLGGAGFDARSLELRQLLVDDASTLYARWQLAPTAG